MTTLNCKIAFENLYSEPQTQEAVNQWKDQMRSLYRTSYKLWLAVKVALAIPILDKSLLRDLSPLKPILVNGKWDRIARRLVPVAWDRGYGGSKIPPAGESSHLKKAEYKYPSPKCIS